MKKIFNFRRMNLIKFSPLFCSPRYLVREVILLICLRSYSNFQTISKILSGYTKIILSFLMFSNSRF